MPNGPFGGFDPLAFFDGVAALFDSVIAAIQSAVVFLYNLLVNVVLFLWSVIQAIAIFLVRAVVLIARGFVHVISDIVHGRFAHLLQDYLKLKDLLRRWLAPIIRIIDRLRNIYRLYVLKPLLAYLNLIQRLRMVLSIFRVFHLKFAQRLDNKLLELEAKTIRNTLRIWQELNIASSVLQLILDPSLLFRRARLTGSILLAINNLLHALFGRGLQGLFGSTVPLGPAAGRPATLRAGMDRFLTEVQAKAGDADVVPTQWQRMFAELRASSGV